MRGTKSCQDQYDCHMQYGGIGKTAMAKEVTEREKDDKLFDEVVMAVDEY